jgi:hypothetical protein
MKIKDMKNRDLVSALNFMANVPENDKYFSGFNFDSEEWGNKFKELIDESIKRDFDHPLEKELNNEERN